MQKIHNSIFYSLIVVLGLSVILLAFGNKALGMPLMLLSIVLFFLEQYTMKKVVKETKNEEIEVKNTYKPIGRMEFLESTLGDDLIGKQEGYDEAVMGFDYHSMRLIYSVEKVIEILMEKEGWDYEEAQDYVYFNIVGARGANEPIWLDCSADFVIFEN